MEPGVPDLRSQAPRRRELRVVVLGDEFLRAATQRTSILMGVVAGDPSVGRVRLCAARRDPTFLDLDGPTEARRRHRRLHGMKSASTGGPRRRGRTEGRGGCHLRPAAARRGNDRALSHLVRRLSGVRPAPPGRVSALAASDFDWDDPDNQRGLAAARPIYEHLTDPELLGADPGLPTDRHSGCCRLCGQISELTYEHFPPRSAHNDGRQRAYGFWAAHEAGETEIGAVPSSGWTSMQRGIGAAVLCGPCNNARTGSRLVPVYSRFARKTVELIAANTSIVDGRLNLPVGFRIDVEDSALGAVARQALVMMMAVSGGAALTRTWPQLFDLVTSDTAGELPTELALGLRLVVGGRSRATGPMVQISRDGYRVFYELSATPFSWNLSVGAPSVHPVIDGADVSGWFSWAPTQRVAATVELPVGIVVTPYPGDFRTTDAVHAESEQLRQAGQAG